MTYYEFLRAAVVAAAVFCGVNASAQVGLRLDITEPQYWTTYSSLNHVSVDKGTGFNLGADYDLRVDRGLHVSPGLYFSYRSMAGVVSLPDVDGSESIEECVINLPILLKWKIDVKPSKLGIYTFVGPVLSCSLSSVGDMKLNVAGQKVNGRYDYFSGEAEYEFPTFMENAAEWDDFLHNELTDRYNRFELRLDFGVGFVFRNHYELTLGYDMGMFDKFRGDYTDSYKRLCHNVSIGFRYRFGKRR